MNMATVPLMSDQDVELGSPPDYDEATKAGRNASASRSGGKIAGSASYFAKYHSEENSASVAFAQVAIRLGFLRKVLGILCFQFGATFVFSTALYLTPNVRFFVQQQAWLVLASAFGSIGILFAMFVYARTVPLNYFLLAIYTILQTIAVGSVVTFYEAEVVIQAVFLTSLVVFGLFCYTLQSKHDFSQLYASLFSMSLILIGASLLQIVLMSPLFNFVVSAFGALVFSMYLIFDLYAIMNLYSEEDYILACISIYMDIMGIFLRIIQLVAELNRN